MSISFNDISSSVRVPYVAVEFDSSKAAQGPALLMHVALLIGQKTAAGAQAADSLLRVSSVADVIAAAGRGSMLHRMAVGWFASNRETEVWLGVLDDDAAGVAATGTIVVTGPATADGTIALWLGGQRVPVAVASGDTATAIGDAIAAAVNAALDLPVTAVNAAGTVTFTFRHKGEVGNSFDMRDSYADGESLPAGVALAYTALGAATAGATNPSLANLFAAMGDAWYTVWAHPYTDATSLTAIEAELADRWGPMRSIDAVAIANVADTYANLATKGESRNSPHSCLPAQPGANPVTPPMEFGAEALALVTKSAAADPARPYQTLEMSNALPPAQGDLFTLEERNLLLFDGIGTTRVQGSTVVLDRIITTYQTNGAGADDDAYLDATTMFTLQYLRYSFRQMIMTSFPRSKLADDGTRLGAGQSVVTPSLAKGAALGWFRQMEDLGLVEGFDQFKADLVVERNAGDPNRLDFLLPPNLINSLIVTAAQIQFRL